MITGIDKTICTGCGICVDRCPLDTLRMDDDGTAYIAYPEDCMTCYICMRYCPVSAITLSPLRGKFPPMFQNKV